MITWISVKDRLPKTHKEVDEDGVEYNTSDLILVWDNDEEEPLGVGVYEDGKFYIGGVSSENVTHWAHINRPDGHLI